MGGKNSKIKECNVDTRVEGVNKWVKGVQDSTSSCCPMEKTDSIILFQSGCACI